MTTEKREELRDDILRSLGHNPERPPVFLTEDETSKVLNVKKNTLTIWRCTGRHEIPTTKVGRAVYYRPMALVDFILQQTTGSTYD